MRDEDVEYLKACLAVGLLVWWHDGDCWCQIQQIADDRQHEREEEREDGPVAYLKDGNGHYVALDAADRNAFMVTSPNMLQWPK